MPAVHSISPQANSIREPESNRYGHRQRLALVFRTLRKGGTENASIIFETSVGPLALNCSDSMPTTPLLDLSSPTVYDLASDHRGFFGLGHDRFLAMYELEEPMQIAVSFGTVCPEQDATSWMGWRSAGAMGAAITSYLPPGLIVSFGSLVGTFDVNEQGPPESHVESQSLIQISSIDSPAGATFCYDEWEQQFSECQSDSADSLLVTHGMALPTGYDVSGFNYNYVSKQEPAGIGVTAACWREINPESAANSRRLVCYLRLSIAVLFGVIYFITRPILRRRVNVVVLDNLRKLNHLIFFFRLGTAISFGTSSPRR
jgi:hypothetical protein